MSARTLVATLVLALLAVPSAAAAKGVHGADVCGAAGCTAAPVNADTYAVFEDGGPIVPPPAEPAPFYELRYEVMQEHGAEREPELIPVRVLFVPSAGLLGGEDGTWMRPDRRAADALRRHLTGIEPFPAAKLDLPGTRDAGDAPATPAGGGGPPVVPLLGAALLAGGAAVAAVSRRRRRPAAG